MTVSVGRIRTSSTHRALARPKGRGSSRGVRVAYIPEVIPGEPAVRVGFAVSKRYGNAVARNRIRRQMRAAAQTLDVPLSPGAYVVRPDAGVKELSFSTLCGGLAEAASRASQSGPSKR